MSDALKGSIGYFSGTGTIGVWDPNRRHVNIKADEYSDDDIISIALDFNSMLVIFEKNGIKQGSYPIEPTLYNLAVSIINAYGHSIQLVEI